MIGAAAATVLAFAIIPIGFGLANRIIFPVPFHWRRTILIGALVLALYGATVLVQTSSTILDLVLRSLIVLLLPLLLAFVPILDPEDRARLRSLLPPALRRV